MQPRATTQGRIRDTPSKRFKAVGRVGDREKNLFRGRGGSFKELYYKLADKIFFGKPHTNFLNVEHRTLNIEY